MIKMSTIKRIKRSLRGCRLKPSLRLCLFEEEYCLDFFGFLIALPPLDRWVREPVEMMDSWGIYYFEKSLVFCFGARNVYFYMPWMWDHCKAEVMRPDGTWVPYVSEYDEKAIPDGRLVERHPYTYILKSGETQNRMATVYAERRTWRWRMFPWLPFKKTRQSISIDFDDEVGERTGSWKGGCIGCGWDMLPGETMLQTLRRMEMDREFN